MKYLTLAVIFVLLPACVSYAAIAPTPQYAGTSYDEKAYKIYEQPGTAKIYGAAYQTIHMYRKPAAGAAIFLVPQSVYTREMYMEGHSLSGGGPYDQKLDKYIRKSSTDQDGRFVFNELPQGAYYIEVILQIDKPLKGAQPKQTVVLSVSVNRGESKLVNLTN